jgi:hypothetical protein
VSRAPAPRDPVAIESARVVAPDLLEMEVSFGGGCRTHEFALLVGRGFRESNPVQAEAALAHDAHGDACEALLRASLRADLTPLSEAWRAAYGRRSGAILLDLQGLATPIRYEF